MLELTSDEYKAKGGIVCPVCQSGDIEGSSVEIDAGGAWQNITCNECGSEWTDFYQLTGYSELTRRTPEAPCAS